MIYFTDSVFDVGKDLINNAVEGNINDVQDVFKRQVGLFLHCKVSIMHSVEITKIQSLQSGNYRNAITL